MDFDFNDRIRLSSKIESITIQWSKKMKHNNPNRIYKILSKKAKAIYQEFSKLKIDNNLYNEYKKFYYSLPAMAKSMFRKQIEGKRPDVLISRTKHGRHYLSFSRFGENIRPRSRAVYDKHYKRIAQMHKKRNEKAILKKT